MAKTLPNNLEKPVQFVAVKPDYFKASLTGTFGESTAKEIANIFPFAEANIEHL